jgi:hypothetical protein
LVKAATPHTPKVSYADVDMAPAALDEAWRSVLGETEMTHTVMMARLMEHRPGWWCCWWPGLVPRKFGLPNPSWETRV